MTYDNLAADHGGVLSTAQLLGSGETERDIRQALDLDLLRRIRHGWYATNDADADVVAAVEAGGVASCVFALHRSGIWVPGEAVEMHCRVTRHGQRIRGRQCRRYGRPTSATAAIDDLPTALQYAARCLDDEGFIVVCDSVANKGLITLEDIATQFAHAPTRIRRLIEKCDARAQSGTESMTRVRLRNVGYRVRVQYRVAKGLHPDLLVGERLAVEIDSKAHHTGEDNYEYDRWRDRQYVKHGLIPIRLTYAHVVTHWPATLADIHAICRNRTHRDPSATAALRRLRAGAAEQTAPGEEQAS